MASHHDDRADVSVILIFFNSEQFLAEAIDSVLAQTFENWELILVDDGSSDGSTTIAKDYAARLGPKVRYIEHDNHRNLGRSAARNAGARAAQSPFLTFIDSDDIWLPNKLEDQIGFLTANPDVAAVWGALLYWYSWNVEMAANSADRAVLTAGIADRTLLPPDAALKAYPLGPASGAAVDFMVRRTIFETLGGFEVAFPGMFDDQTIILKIFLAAPVHFSSKIWLKYRQHPESCCGVSERDGSYLAERTHFLDWLEQYVRTHNPQPRILKAIAQARQTPLPGERLVRRMLRALIRRLVPRGDGPLGRFHA
jgi:Glycosyltransferases involved in cell wall biogenesis